MICVRCRECKEEMTFEAPKPGSLMDCPFEHESWCGFMIAMENGSHEAWIGNHGYAMEYSLGIPMGDSSN
jgi:hypothetical protein